MKRRAISFLTALALCLSLCPMRVLAADDADPGDTGGFPIDKDTEVKETLVVIANRTFDTQGFTYTVSDQTAVSVRKPGRLYLTTGRIESKNGAGIEVQDGCFLRVDQPGMTVAGTTYGLDIAAGATVRLSGGTFTGNISAIRLQGTSDYSALLASAGGTYYAYFDEDVPIPLTEVGRHTTVKVKECTAHVYDYAARGVTPKHIGTCVFCGIKTDEKFCTFSFGQSSRAECDNHCGHTITITIKQPSGDPVYNGEPQPGAVEVTVMLDGSIKLTEDADYTVTNTTSTDAGDFTVTVTVGTDNGTFQKTFRVTQARPEITWNDDIDVPVERDYDGAPVDDLPGVSVSGIIEKDRSELEKALYYSYKKWEEDGTASDAGYTEGLPTDAGTYEIIASLPEHTNYEAASSAPIILTIKPIDPIIDAPEAAKDLVYNGAAQALVANGAVWDGAVILYALSKDGMAPDASDYSESIPTGIDAGEYSVWYKVVGTNNYEDVDPTEIKSNDSTITKSVRIKRKPITPVVELEYDSYLYDGGEIQPKVTVRDPDTWVELPNSEYAVTYKNNTEARTKTDKNPPTVTVTDKAGGNYDIAEKPVFFDITAADQAALHITKTPDSVFYGDVFTLETAGGSGSGTVTWALLDSSGAEASNTAVAKIDRASGQVTVTGVGTATVRATKTGSDYKTATAEWTFTAGPKHVTATVAADNKTYDNTDAATVTAAVAPGDLVSSGDVIQITGTAEGAKLTGKFSDANAGTGKTVAVDTDTATVKVNGTQADVEAGKKYFVTEKYIVTIPGTATADITKAATEITTDPTAAAQPYTGSDQSLVTPAAAGFTTTVTGTVDITVEYALHESGPYSTAIPKAANAGGYEVWYRVRESGNYSGTAARSVSVTIEPKEATPSVILDRDAFVYDGSEKKPAVTVMDGSVEIPASEYTVTYSNHVNAKKATETDPPTVTVKSRAGGNYKFTATKKFTIEKAPAVLTGTPQAVANLIYNGEEQDLVAVGTAEGGSLAYGLAGDDGAAPTTYGPEIPQGKDAKQYKVYYKVVGDSNHTDTAPAYVYVTISPKTVVSPVITLAAAKDGAYTDAYQVEYNGSPQKPFVMVKDGDTDVNEGGRDEYTVTYSDNTNAGTATVRITDRSGGNYTVNGSATFEITKAKASFTPVPAGKSALTYSGRPQELITAGVPSGGTAVYRLDDGEYSEEIPTGTNRGEYTVHAKVLGDANHEDSDEITPINVTIDPKSVSPTVTCSPAVFPYDGTEKTPNVTVTYTENSAVQVIPDSEYTVTFGDPQRKEVGRYTVTVTAIEGGNYTFSAGGGASATGTFEIKPADQVPLSIVTDRSPIVRYGDTFTLSTVGGSGDGTVIWGVESTPAGIAGITQDGKVTVKGTGAFTVTAYKEDTNGSYNRSEASITFTANPKPLTLSITAADKDYNGKTNADVTAKAWNNGDLVSWDGISDQIRFTVTGAFDTATVGTGKRVSVTVTFDDGGDTNYISGNYVTVVQNYEITYPAVLTASIYKVDAKLKTAPAAKTGLSYTGSGLELITGGETEDGIGAVTYSTSEKGAYTADIPKAATAGTYTVWYRVAESVNWTGIGPVCIEVTIGKATPNIEWPTASEIEPDQPLSESDLNGGKATFNGEDVRGDFAWKDGDVKYEEGKSYEVVFTPDDTVNYETVTKEIKIGEDASENPGGGDANGTTPGTAPGSGTTSSTAPGSSGTAAPSAGGPGAGSASTQTTVRDGTASTVVSAAAGDELVNEAVANQSGNVVIKPEITGDVTKAEVSLPASAVSRIGAETDAALTVSTPIADVTIPNGSLGALSGAGGTVSVAAEQVDNTVVLTLSANGRDVGVLPGGLTLTVPAEDAGPGTVAVLVYEDGARETIRKSVADNGAVRIPLSGSATVEIVDNSREFADVPAENWAADAVVFASAHEMFNGTGETTFSPELSMSRAMLTTVLYNLEGHPDQDLTGAFSDIDGDTWYADSVLWAAENGITSGYGNGQFGPNDSITREQLAVMLWRYAGSPAAKTRTLDFTDADQAGGYAVEALCWAASNGILNGYGNGRIDPTGLATRAQAAQMLKNFMENT